LDETCPQALGKGESPVAGLAQVSNGEQAEASMEQLRSPAKFFEVIADHPISKGVGAPLYALHTMQDKRGTKCRVVDEAEMRR
jgi:hypothetical protein